MEEVNTVPLIIRRYWTKTVLFPQCLHRVLREITLARRTSSVFSKRNAYTWKNQKLLSKPHSSLRSSFSITILKEYKAVQDLLLTRSVADGMMLIGKLVKGLSLLFPGSGLTKRKRCSRTASRKSHTTLGSLPSVALSSV